MMTDPMNTPPLDDPLEVEVNNLKARIAAAISHDATASAKVYALIETAFDVKGEDGREFLREVFAECYFIRYCVNESGDKSRESAP
jgi:ferritin